MKDFIVISKKRKDLFKKNEGIEREIEKLTDTKMDLNDEISIEGESFNVFQAKQILKAFGRGFDVKDCLYLLEDNYGLEAIDLTEFIKSRKRLKILKGRIIGTGGKTKKYIETYADVKLSILGKTVSIIGEWEKITIAKEAVMKIIVGCTHKTLYRWLEQKSVKKW